MAIAARPPAASAPNALWIDNSGGSYSIDYTPSAPQLTKITATLAVDFSRFSGGVAPEVTFIAIGARAAAFDHCYVALQVNLNGLGLYMQSHCGITNVNKYKTVSASLPSASTFVPIRFTVDLAAGTAETVLADQPLVRLDLQFSTPTTGSPHVELGLFGVSGLTGPEIALDDVLVTTE